MDKIICDCNKSYKSKTWFNKHIINCDVYKNNWEIVKNKQKPLRVSFNKNIHFNYDERKYIIHLLNNLHYTNDKFKSLCFSYGYNSVAVIKNIHRDNWNYFFTAFLFSDCDDKSNNLHFYINDNDEIYKITEMIDLL